MPKYRFTRYQVRGDNVIDRKQSYTNSPANGLAGGKTKDMISRVKRIIRPASSNAMNAYFSSVNRHADNCGPTFAEAQKDFQNLAGRFSHFPR